MKQKLITVFVTSFPKFQAVAFLFLKFSLPSSDISFCADTQWRSLGLLQFQLNPNQSKTSADNSCFNTPSPKPNIFYSKWVSRFRASFKTFLTVCIILFNNLRFHYNAVVYYKKLYFDDHTLVLAVMDAFLFTRYSTTLSCPSLAAQWRGVRPSYKATNLTHIICGSPH